MGFLDIKWGVGKIRTLEELIFKMEKLVIKLNRSRRQKRPFLPQFYNLLFFGFFFIMTDPTTFYLFSYEKEQKSRQKMTVVTDEPLGNIIFRTFNSRQLTYNLKNHGI